MTPGPVILRLLGAALLWLVILAELYIVLRVLYFLVTQAWLEGVE